MRTLHNDREGDRYGSISCFYYRRCTYLRVSGGVVAAGAGEYELQGLPDVAVRQCERGGGGGATAVGAVAGAGGGGADRGGDAAGGAGGVLAGAAGLVRAGGGGAGHGERDGAVPRAG